MQFPSMITNLCKSTKQNTKSIVETSSTTSHSKEGKVNEEEASEEEQDIKPTKIISRRVDDNTNEQIFSDGMCARVTKQKDGNYTIYEYKLEYEEFNKLINELKNISKSVNAGEWIEQKVYKNK